ncbi:hypothetical protein ABID16_003091 [Rhizobium aquaticum]|uniref:Plasmid mobilization relaxosome protein MobC n=1 Tax=Rhizobium aquaticum TaxID=1549636 RepID=A0ABV2J4I3_9HYPH
MRNKLMKVRLTQSELATILEAAEAKGLTVSELCRRSALGVRLPRRRLDRRDAEILARLLASLGKIGSNLNQLVRAVNIGKVPIDDNATVSTLRDIDYLRQHIREILQ